MVVVLSKGPIISTCSKAASKFSKNWISVILIENVMQKPAYLKFACDHCLLITSRTRVDKITILYHISQVQYIVISRMLNQGVQTLQTWLQGENWFGPHFTTILKSSLCGKWEKHQSTVNTKIKHADCISSTIFWGLGYIT